jgi:hypothetical protein
MIILPKPNLLCGAQNPPGMMWCPPDFNNPNNIVLWFETMNIGGWSKKIGLPKKSVIIRLSSQNIPKYAKIIINPYPS